MTQVKTDPKADCFGPGTGGSGDRVTVPGSTALGQLANAGASTTPISPLGVTDAFDFGLGICGIGEAVAPATGFWYLKVDHAASSRRATRRRSSRGDEVLWYLIEDFNDPTPDELELERTGDRRGGRAVRGQGDRLRRRRRAKPGRGRDRHRGRRARPTPRAGHDRRRSTRPDARRSARPDPGAIRRTGDRLHATRRATCPRRLRDDDRRHRRPRRDQRPARRRDDRRRRRQGQVDVRRRTRPRPDQLRRRQGPPDRLARVRRTRYRVLRAA